MIKLKVADYILDYYSNNELLFSKWAEEYIVNSSLNADVVIKYYLVEKITLKDNLKFIKREGDLLEYKSEDNLNYIYQLNGDLIVRCYVYSDDYSYNECYCLPSNVSIASDIGIDIEFEYLYSGCIFNNFLLVNNAFVIHGSAISYKNKGIIFSAPPGTGKSTHTSKWSKKNPNDVLVINDDKPIVKFIDNKPYIYGSFWSGKDHLDNNVKVPLKHIVFINRGEENSISACDLTTAVCYMYDQAISPFMNDNIAVYKIEIIKSLISLVSIHNLYSNLDIDIDLVKKYLFG